MAADRSLFSGFVQIALHKLALDKKSKIILNLTDDNLNLLL